MRARALKYLGKGRVVLFAAGSGNPLFTTDSAAALRAVEIGANLMIKATRVDGVYDKDPVIHSDAVHFDNLSYDEMLQNRLEVMDATAVTLCRDHNMPIRVCNMNTTGSFERLARGESLGTLIGGEANT